MGLWVVCRVEVQGREETAKDDKHDPRETCGAGTLCVSNHKRKDEKTEGERRGSRDERIEMKEEQQSKKK
jgi:hypothetical protein